MTDINILNVNIEALPQVKTDKENNTVTVKDHFRYFWLYTSRDVWTQDGWLITAVQDNGTTHHLRKGTAYGTAELKEDTVLYYKGKKVRLID